LFFDNLLEEIDAEGEECWLIKYNKSRLLLLSEDIGSLPIMLYSPIENPDYFEKITINSKIHYKIKKVDTLRLRPECTMTTNKWFHSFLDIPHSNSSHFDIYKGLNLCALLGGRINVRVASESEFGKNGVTKTGKLMSGNARVISPASFPALLRGLPSTNLLNITEPKQFEGFDTFLENMGDRDDSFENPKISFSKPNQFLYF